MKWLSAPQIALQCSAHEAEIKQTLTYIKFNSSLFCGRFNDTWCGLIFDGNFLKRTRIFLLLLTFYQLANGLKIGHKLYPLNIQISLNLGEALCHFWGTATGWILAHTLFWENTHSSNRIVNIISNFALSWPEQWPKAYGWKPLIPANHLIILSHVGQTKRMGFSGGELNFSICHKGLAMIYTAKGMPSNVGIELVIKDIRQCPREPRDPSYQIAHTTANVKLNDSAKLEQQMQLHWRDNMTITLPGVVKGESQLLHISSF